MNAFSDSELRGWAVKHGFLRSDAEIKRDELVALVSSKYADVKAQGSKCEQPFVVSFAFALLTPSL